MAKSRIVVRKLIWACIILWIIFCIGKGVYEEMVKFGEEIDVIERKKQQNETCNVILENVHKNMCMCVAQMWQPSPLRKM